jgi:NADH:ubiquinone oxidoreductase subunit K
MAMLSDVLIAYLVIAAFLFAAGVYGMVQKRSFIGMLISIELMLNGAGLNCMAFNRFLAADPAVGQVLTLFIMGIAAAEAAVGVSFILAVYKRFRTMDPTRIFILKR